MFAQNTQSTDVQGTLHRRADSECKEFNEEDIVVGKYSCSICIFNWAPVGWGAGL